MRPRYIFATIIFDAVLVVMFASLVSCSARPDDPDNRIAPPEVQQTPAEHIAFKVDTEAPVPATAELAPTQLAPKQDGVAVLNSHCAACHDTAWFSQIEKPRAEWELALSQMEGMGVHLSDAEKDALLDYLAVADKP